MVPRLPVLALPVDGCRPVDSRGKASSLSRRSWAISSSTWHAALGGAGKSWDPRPHGAEQIWQTRQGLRTATALYQPLATRCWRPCCNPSKAVCVRTPKDSVTLLRPELDWFRLHSRHRPGVMRCLFPQVHLHLFYIDTGQEGLRSDAGGPGEGGGAAACPRQAQLEAQCH